MKFSSRINVLMVVFVTAVLAFGTVFAVDQFYIQPQMKKEHDRRVEIMPALLAIANQKAIITNDLATLRTTLDLTMNTLQASGLKYIIVQDAEGKILTEVFQSSISQTEKKRILAAIIQHAARGRQQTSASPVSVDQSKLSTAEREALVGQSRDAPVVVPDDLPTDQLPRIERRTRWRLRGLEPAILDYSIPVSTGSIRFGGVRAGVADELTGFLNNVQLIIWSAAVLLIVVVGGISLTVAQTIDSKFGRENREALDALRKEMESKVRHLEAEQARREEDNPITPAEFLSLLDYARKISGSLDYNEVLHISIHSALQVMSVRDASVFVLDATTNELVGRIGHDENGLMPDEEMAAIKVPVGKGDIGAAAEFGTTTTIDTPRPGSSVVSALVSRGRTIGVLLVRNKLNGRPFIKKDATLVRIFSGLLANAMENAAIFHHLQR